MLRCFLVAFCYLDYMYIYILFFIVYECISYFLFFISHVVSPAGIFALPVAVTAVVHAAPAAAPTLVPELQCHVRGVEGVAVVVAHLARTTSHYVTA